MGFDPDILGAIFFEQKQIVIDENLDPDANSAKEGRYLYIAAYEVGHWRLHRGLFGKDPAQASLLDANTPPRVICRTSQAKARIELQADLYASCLLIPRKLVFAARDQAFPDRSSGCLSRPNRSTTRSSRSRASRAAFPVLLSPKRRSGVGKLPYALRRKVPRFADRDARPARKARALAPHGAPSAASVRWLVIPFFEDSVKCQLNERSTSGRTGQTPRSRP